MDGSPRNEAGLLDPYMFFRGTPGLLRTLQGPRRSRRRTCRALSTSAASSCLLAVSAESRSPPKPRTCGIAPSTRQGVGTPRQSIIFALPLRQTERRCRECHPAPTRPLLSENTPPVEQLGGASPRSLHPQRRHRLNTRGPARRQPARQQADRDGATPTRHRRRPGRAEPARGSSASAHGYSPRSGRPATRWQRFRFSAKPQRRRTRRRPSAR